MDQNKITLNSKYRTEKLKDRRKTKTQKDENLDLPKKISRKYRLT